MADFFFIKIMGIHLEQWISCIENSGTPKIFMENPCDLKLTRSADTWSPILAGM